MLPSYIVIRIVLFMSSTELDIAGMVGFVPVADSKNVLKMSWYLPSLLCCIEYKFYFGADGLHSERYPVGKVDQSALTRYGRFRSGLGALALYTFSF